MSSTAEDLRGFTDVVPDRPVRPAPDWGPEQGIRLDRAEVVGLQWLVEAGPAIQEEPTHLLGWAIDELGQFVVQDDVIGTVYGVGHTPGEAMEDFSHALAERLEILRSRRLNLHPRLQRELLALERRFPGR
jgi:hypothetical protein